MTFAPEGGMAKVRVLLADDHRMFREGVRLLIATQPDIEVVGEAENGRAAVDLATSLRPDVVVMDVSMPDMNGLNAARILTASHPVVRVLILTRHGDGGYLQQLLQAGVSGYILKQSASEELVRAIRAVAGGKAYLDSAMTEHALGSARAPAARGSTSGKTLTGREEEILRLVAWGLLNREIADRLEISIKTVEAHKANAMGKLGISSRIGVVRYALLREWLKEN
jgi:DNA-binding NarL/FixJ family response regulator